jgi:hypothetical protein
VTLDTIVAAFDSGATAGEIAQQYSSISLADVYSVVAYYLRKRPKSPPTFTGAGNTATVREEVERRSPPSGIRERLIARRRWERPFDTAAGSGRELQRRHRPRAPPTPNPKLDIVRVQDEGLSGADDPSFLQWAAD